MATNDSINAVYFIAPIDANDEYNMTASSELIDSLNDLLIPYSKYILYFYYAGSLSDKANSILATHLLHERQDTQRQRLHLIEISPHGSAEMFTTYLRYAEAMDSICSSSCQFIFVLPHDRIDITVDFNSRLLHLKNKRSVRIAFQRVFDQNNSEFVLKDFHQDFIASLDKSQQEMLQKCLLESPPVYVSMENLPFCSCILHNHLVRSKTTVSGRIDHVGQYARELNVPKIRRNLKNVDDFYRRMQRYEFINNNSSSLNADKCFVSNQFESDLMRQSASSGKFKEKLFKFLGFHYPTNFKEPDFVRFQTLHHKNPITLSYEGYRTKLTVGNYCFERARSFADKNAAEENSAAFAYSYFKQLFRVTVETGLFNRDDRLDMFLGCNTLSKSNDLRNSHNTNMAGETIISRPPLVSSCEASICTAEEGNAMSILSQYCIRCGIATPPVKYNMSKDRTFTASLSLFDTTWKTMRNHQKKSDAKYEIAQQIVHELLRILALKRQLDFSPNDFAERHFET